VNKLIQLLLIFAILFTALFGLGFGLCGVWGFSMAVTGPASQTNGTILMLAALGIIVAVMAGALIYFVLWKNLRRRSREDEEDQP
jgi:phosphotransferase system  glucose/maltose/N-acetylglucosamine-specific IIC component